VKERLKKYAPYAIYPLFYVVCLAIFAALTFPYDKLKERIVGSFNAQQRATNGTQELQIDDLSSYWLTGVKATGIKLLSLPTEPGKPPGELKIDEARVRVSILSAMVGNQDVSFKLNAFGGEVSGSYGVHGKDKDVDVTIDGVDLSQVEPITSTLGVPVEGRLSGTVKIAMPEGKASKASGAVSLEAKDVAIGDGKAKIMRALALPKLNVGALSLAGDAKDGVLKVSKLGAGGKDLELQGEGRVQMRELATESLLDVNLRFKINDAYRTKNDVTKSLFGAPGSNAPALFELADPRIKGSKRPDGFYAWSARGQLGRPDFQPSSGGGGAPMPSMPYPASSGIGDAMRKGNP
jgi:type II secretion system protein N